jgi:hypothetical protein
VIVDYSRFSVISIQSRLQRIKHLKLVLGMPDQLFVGSFVFILILQIVALILVNLKKGEIVRTVGGYVAIVAAIIDIITFFLVFVPRIC